MRIWLGIFVVYGVFQQLVRTRLATTPHLKQGTFTHALSVYMYICKANVGCRVAPEVGAVYRITCPTTGG